MANRGTCGTCLKPTRVVERHNRQDQKGAPYFVYLSSTRDGKWQASFSAKFYSKQQNPLGKENGLIVRLWLGSENWGCDGDGDSYGFDRDTYMAPDKLQEAAGVM
ncbi:predicted protein [Coccidioides posadasii str. Silveira]|uniref:Predicted protein n=1 Tax=Coccidioides posadasii (strain RMSCC 757 / Silveira) TaxID=443226 RepID=E9D7N7_COCPS|nr:predicted protein [Coccidioides posadasii str. Silveira]